MCVCLFTIIFGENVCSFSSCLFLLPLKKKNTRSEFEKSLYTQHISPWLNKWANVFFNPFLVCCVCVFDLCFHPFSRSLKQRQFWRGTIYWSSFLSIIFLMSNWKNSCLTVDPKYFHFSKSALVLYFYILSLWSIMTIYLQLWSLGLRLIGGLTDLPLNGILPLTKLVAFSPLSISWAVYLGLFPFSVLPPMCVSHPPNPITTLFWFM